MNPRYDFNTSNCGRVCPIMGHYEVSGAKVEDTSTTWQITSGVFLQSEKQDELNKWIYEKDEEMKFNTDEL